MSYEDIIHLPHHVSSKRASMSMHDRAAQFAPFAALTGHDAIIRETARQVDAPIELTESRREDGIKFSVRSELADIHAGQLIHRTLQDLGSGGGHAGMAGGLIPEANVPLLGDHPEDNIIRMFLDQLDCIDCSKQL